MSWPSKARTRLVGLIGYPIEHSVSPAMHNAAFAAMDLSYYYVLLPVKPGRLEEAIAGLRALGLAGGNVTIPHKERAAACVDELSVEAQAIGAINTIVVSDDRVCGHNTDWTGFTQALKSVGFSPRGKRAVVLGAGGAARAVIYALAREQADVVVCNRTLAHAEELVRVFSPQFPNCSLTSLALTEQHLFVEVPSADLLVNATPVGAWPRAEESLLPDNARLESGSVVFDCVYNPPETRLVRQARERGARAVGGLDMLVWQGVQGFTLWTGQEPPFEVMYAAAREAL